MEYTGGMVSDTLLDRITRLVAMGRTVLLIAPGLGFEAIFPLALSTLAAALRGAGHRCSGLDERARPGCLQAALKSVGSLPAEERPIAAVVETSTRNVREVIDVTAECGAAGIPVILVGVPAATNAPAMLDSTEAFAAVTGDPETVVLSLLEEIGRPTGTPIVGARYRAPDAVLVEKAPEFNLDFARLMYDRTVFPLADYSNHPRHPEFKQAAIETSRGCGLACRHCPIPRRYGGLWRGRPVGLVVDEMVGLHREHGITDFVIEDDQPLHDIERFHAFLRAVKTRLPGITMAFSNGLRPDLLGRQTLQMMAAAGTRDISLGIESGSPAVRRTLNRAASGTLIGTVISEAHRFGMLVTGYFMLGTPGETSRQMLETFVMANRLPFDYVHFMVYHPWQVTTGPASSIYGQFKTAAYLGSYCNPLRLAALARRGEIKPGKATADLRRLIEWVTAGTTGGGTW